LVLNVWVILCTYSLSLFLPSISLSLSLSLSLWFFKLGEDFSHQRFAIYNVKKKRKVWLLILLGSAKMAIWKTQNSYLGRVQLRLWRFLIAVHCDITQWYMTSSHGYKSNHLSIHA